jgi:adenylate cyclase
MPERIRQLTALLRPHGLHSAVLLLVFLLFASSAIGLLEFSLRPGGGISLRGDMFFEPGGGLRLPAVAQSPEFLLLAFAGLLLCVLLPLLPPIGAALATAAAAVPFVLLGLSTARIHAPLPMEFSMLTIGVIFSVDVLIGYFRETRAKHQILNVFGQFIPPHVVAEIAKHPEQLNLEGEARRLTVFFCDLQNFSGVAEQLNPRQLTLLLNEYFNEMTDVLFRHGATIDKYIGDSIMAFWGAPLAQPDHARRAILASFEMHRGIKRLAEEFVRRGWPGPTMGIGINTGMMNVGNMGSRYRISYTVVGDSVNLASRLETLTRVYRVPTVVSEYTREECRDIAFRTLDVVQVRGKHNRTRIYEPLCEMKELSETMNARLVEHERAMEHLFAEQWPEAGKILQKLHDSDPGDRLYPVLLGKVTAGNA